MKVAFLPTSRNPYLTQLSNSLAVFGVEVEHRLFPTNNWLFRNRNDIRILHIHWPNVLYSIYWPFIGKPLTLLRFLYFSETLYFARKLGYKIVWTAHNLMPHISSIRCIDFLARQMIVSQASALFAHCEFARHELIKNFDIKCEIHVIPHGNFGIYPNTISKKKARQELKIEQMSFVYLFFGNIHQYKGVNELIQSFKRLDDKNIRLVIAGKPWNDEIAQTLNSVAGNDGRILLYMDFVADIDIQKYLSAADVFVAPYKRIFTSGSTILGLTWGLPVIAPSLGCIPELIKPEIGILYDESDPDGLISAMTKIRAMDLKKMGKNALLTAQELDWLKIARETHKVYLQCLN